MGLDRRIKVPQPRNHHPRAWVTFSPQIHHHQIDYDYELKGLRASKNTHPRGPNTGVAKRAASVQVEHVRKLRKLDQKLYGTDIDSASPPGPLLRRFHALGEVHPIVFGAYGEVSERDGGPHRQVSRCMGTADR